MNLTQLAQKQNAKLTKPQANLLAKLDSYGATVSDSVPDTIPTTNPITGYQAELPALVSCLVRLVYVLMRSYENSPTYQMKFNGHNVPISIFDRVKYLVLALDKDAYANFVD